MSNNYVMILRNLEPSEADVIVPNMKNATDVLQSLQRQRFGKKRILVTLTQQSDMRYESVGDHRVGVKIHVTFS